MKSPIIEVKELTKYYDHLQVLNNLNFDIMNGEFIFYPLKSTGASIITAFFYRIFGVNSFAALMPNMILSSISIFLIYGLCKRFFDKRAGIIAALFLAIFPEHLFYVNLIGSDVYFAFLILLTFNFYITTVHFSYSPFNT